jgi:hypothetical protein
MDAPLQADEGEVFDDIGRLEKRKKISLEEAQREAVTSAITHMVSVITGGPGTGKTTITNLVINYFREKGLSITLAAPTGRAAKRMAEATGYPAKTIHRLLGAGAVVEGRPWQGFEHDADNPIETDVLILDEMSMVDIYVFRSLLRALVQLLYRFYALHLCGFVFSRMHDLGGLFLPEAFLCEAFPLRLVFPACGRHGSPGAVPGLPGADHLRVHAEQQIPDCDQVL